MGVTRLVCRLRGIWETVTLPLFWKSLVNPPLVVVSGHIWPEENGWSEPVFREDAGWVEYLTARCERCGKDISDGGWRYYWGLVR